MNNEKLEKLILRLANRDINAMADIYEEVKTPVYALALSMLKSPADAEDALHNTMLALYKTAETYNPQGKAGAFIMGIARNQSLMLLRNRERTNVPDAENYISEAVDGKGLCPEERLLLEYCLSILSDTDKEIVILHAIAGFKHAEIGEILDIPLSTVLSKYNRAIKKMSILVEE